ncbi:leucine-rich repeat domain-containing protein [Marinimicrobium sp. C2-29]|uniref:leucine-rich repeat domain-containing protein n=1 Tax=Marinimicrobium sp. C2-29 TaxID=3139825 RepID=UPI003138F5CE
MVHSNNTVHSFFRWFLPATFLALGGCAGYTFNLNDNPVYNPPTLFSDYRLEDAALNECVEQAIADQRITLAGQLNQLNCSSTEIKTLAGLSRFTGLEALSLRGNQIASVEPLKGLAQLEILDIRSNRLSSTAPLRSLERLKEVDLRGNDSLECGEAQKLAEKIGDKVRLPGHCG